MSRNPGRSGNPATRASAGASSAQQTPSGVFHARSRTLLLRLSRLPTLLIPAFVLVLMIVGLSARLAFAVPALALVGAYVGWLAYLSWPILPPRARLLRVMMGGIVVGSAVARIMGWL